MIYKKEENMMTKNEKELISIGVEAVLNKLTHVSDKDLAFKIADILKADNGIETRVNGEALPWKEIISEWESYNPR